MKSSGFTIRPPEHLAAVMSVSGLLSAAWLYFLPVPYGVAFLINGAAPLVAIVILLLWPGAFVLGGKEAAYRGRNLAGLWTLPPIALAIRAWQDFQLVYTPQPVMAGLGLGLLFAAAAGLLDKRSRKNGMVLFALVAGCLWGWGLVMLANVELDRTPGRIRPAVVASKYHPSRGPPTLTVGLTDGSLIGLEFPVDDNAHDAAKAGDRVCVEDNPGLFGWRTLWLVDCTGPLKELTPPAP